jgi:hypothetical protein
VVVAIDVVVEIGDHVVQFRRYLRRRQRESRYALQGHRRDHTERPETDRRGWEQLGVDIELRAIGAHEFHAVHLGGEPAEPRAGAVGTGGNRAGHRLRVDVTEVRERQIELPQRFVQVAQRRPRQDGHEC